MKIKAISESTGLSDRTIRYYIEQGIIFPDYTENSTSDEKPLIFHRRISMTLVT
ncbi:MAG: MerR family DNA-binding transcriptional regulator [Clostridia bacterium]|nr:MerR family DNA-binding transcriptional regulator [Clostridia bacterium]